MKIQEQDIYHGPALMHVVEHPSFKALNKASKVYGHYLINTDRHLFVKYSTKKKSPWQFTFNPIDFKAMVSNNIKGAKVYIALVCGRSTICALTISELNDIVDLTAKSVQTVTVKVPSGGSCHVHGSDGELKNAVAHNAFPTKVFY